MPSVTVNKLLNGHTHLCALPYVVVKKAATSKMMICRHIVELLLFHWASEAFIGTLSACLQQIWAVDIVK
jgi:hypothetical protein